MVYETSHIKRRRATKAEMEARASALIDIVVEIAPATVRQVFYQATVRGVIEKTDTRSKNWRGDSVELDAINPNKLRELVEEVLEEHLPEEEFAVLKAAEASERELLRVWAGSLEAPA